MQENLKLDHEGPPASTGREAGREALDHLFSQVSRYRNSREYFEMMRFIAKLPIYAPYNMFLLYTQNPQISYVATASRWKRKFQRKVKRDARPLVILAPMCPVLFVYDLMDTEGEPVPDDILRPFRTTGRLDGRIRFHTMENCAAKGIRLGVKQFGHTQAGYCRRLLKGREVRLGEDPPARFEVVSKAGSSPENEYATVVHELGHILLGHLGPDTELKVPERNRLTTQMKEIEAESVSYLVCSRKGIETTSAQYLAWWSRRNTELPEFSLDMVLHVAGKIETWGTSKPRKREERSTAK